jgi:putative inorganic carbon (HCO3(-)) transporter
VKLPGFASLVARMPQFINNLPGAVDGFNSNEVAGTLLWFVPLSLALALSPRILSHHLIGVKIIRPIVIFMLWGFVLLTTATFILTQSRSGYLAFVVAGIFILWGLLHPHKLLSWGLLILVIGLGTAFISLVGWQQLEQLVFAFGNDAISAEGIALTGRTEIWVRALYAIEDFPITGVGMNLFRYIVPVLYPFFTLSNELNIAHAHNQFLQAGVDLGIPGLIAYMAIWLGLVGMLRQSWRWSRDAWGKTLTIGFTASLIASFIFGLTDAVSLGAKPGFMFWFLLGLIVGHYRLLAAANHADNGS